MKHIILITTYNRLNLLKKCMESLWNTIEQGTPIFVVNDGSKQETTNYLYECMSKNLIDVVINSKINMGISPSISSGMNYIFDFVRFFSADRRKEFKPYISYIQDDMLFTKKNWPSYCIEKFSQAKKLVDVDFMTGFDFSYEFDENNHPRIHKDITLEGCHFRKSMSGQHMMASIDTWKERLPVPTFRDGSVVRGHPHNGIGSCVDWWLIRDSKPSKTLAVEDIAVYDGKKKSTWQSF